jgi:hypothetical protein
VSTQAAVLLAILLVGHFLGDFTPLATARMQKAKANGGPMRWIAAHAALHALLTGLVVAAVAGPEPSLLAMAIGLQFLTHWALDAFRARLGVRIPALVDPGKNVYWTALGLDQLAHALVVLGITVIVV